MTGEPAAGKRAAVDGSGPPAGSEPAAARPLLSVTEFTDPACPWAWGSEPSFRLLRHTLGPSARWRRVFGILFDEDDDPAPDPDAEARWYEQFIREVTAHTKAPYARRLRWLTRSSWPASLAAKAAQSQGPEIAEQVLRRLRESTFVLGTPADTADGVLAAVRGVPGLDTGRLLSELAAPATREAVRADWAETRRPVAAVLDLDEPGPHPGRAKEVGDCRRYALPTLLFDGPGGRVCVPGWRSVETCLDAARTAAGGPLPLTSVRLSATAALERWRSLTGPELALLTEERKPPSEAVRTDTGNGPLWRHPDEPVPEAS
ncbi:DsbA family protein [Streptomyces sp. AK02-01A]|uniref:DsbA family oxidoreductase n=1 Tax=Streptomyces sp. AK02-01A TaxID=3028648 RepID=UPI0029B59B08|nr:DsbA family protein [Streptomyces sp. AK02-01A]MDX3850078.1 DsbA family protein [Streptomyces sp. AK02-01A]